MTSKDTFKIFLSNGTTVKRNNADGWATFAETCRAQNLTVDKIEHDGQDVDPYATHYFCIGQVDTVIGLPFQSTKMGIGSIRSDGKYRIKWLRADQPSYNEIDYLGTYNMHYKELALERTKVR